MFTPRAVDASELFRKFTNSSALSEVWHYVVRADAEMFTEEVTNRYTVTAGRTAAISANYLLADSPADSGSWAAAACEPATLSLSFD